MDLADSLASELIEFCAEYPAFSILLDAIGAPSETVFFFQEEDGIRDGHVTGVQTCALPISYLERMSQELRQAGVEVDAVLAAGDPAKEIAATAEREQVDLIAMATHGHSLLSDVVHGTTATALRHVSRIPILMVRAPAPGP